MAQLVIALAVALALPAFAGAQAPAGDRDDQFVVTGCVTPAGDARGAWSHSILVWSRGNVYLSSLDARFKPSERPVGTSGPLTPVFYWIDDEDDFAKHVGQRVEIVGEISDDLEKGEIEFDHEGDFTDIEFDVKGHEAKARIPTAWLGPQTRGLDTELDVTVRTVDVEKVTVQGPCK